MRGMRLSSNSPEHTLRLGERLGRALEAGSVVALIGELGSGKTLFTQGIAKGLGVGPDEYVSSPSFAIINQYRGRIPVFHVDTYRLRNESEMIALGYEDYFDPAGVTIIEWADKVERLLPEKSIRIRFAITGREAREIEVELSGEWSEPEARRIMNSFGAEKP